MSAAHFVTRCQKMKNLISHFLVLLVISSSFGLPIREDDEYEDDIEYPVRKAEAAQKHKEQLEKQGYTTTSKPKPLILSSDNPELYSDVPPTKKWVHAKNIQGYQILSDGPRIVTEFIKTRPMLRIRIDAPGSVRDVQQTINKRNLELKIRHWNSVHKVHINVPFGYTPDELYVAELSDHIEIIAPLFADIDLYK